MNDESDVEFDDEINEPVENEFSARFSDAVLFSSDWTVETILSQLKRNNIQLNPNFQRREAWGNTRKSRFIETVIVGLPAPQLVLAEVRNQRGKYLVLDGKQRLLSLLRFTESESDRDIGFGLSGLEIRNDLARVKYYHMYNDVLLQADLDAFLNYNIRTVIIRNWPNNDFLHQVFLRLNTGSVKLSPQELRQAMSPGPFTRFVDDFSANSKQIQSLLGRTSPDPRMRDVELLVRHIAFRDNLHGYKGRMKRFLDEICEFENKNWASRESVIVELSRAFENAIQTLSRIFGSRIARKPKSNSFNRAIFDALSFYAAQPEINSIMASNEEKFQDAYQRVFDRSDFLEAIESDTAGMPNTVSRIRIWGETIRPIIRKKINVPVLKDGLIYFDEI